METKYVRVPFEVELAKKITDKFVEGRIVRNYDNADVRIVCFDQKYEGDYILGCLVSQKCGEGYSAYKQNGKNLSDDKSDYDLMLEIPEYMTFKDGDILIDRAGEPFIYNGVRHNGYGYICGINYDGRLCISSNSNSSWTSTVKGRATEQEKQKLIDALKASKEPKAKECLKILGIEVKHEYEFKPFDKVLARDSETDKWRADMFSHKSKEGNFVCIGYIWKQCIPYNEQTAHLIGTTEKWEL